MSIRSSGGRSDGSPEYERLTSDEAGAGKGGAGRWFVRNLPATEGDGTVGSAVEELVEVDPDYGLMANAAPSVTSDEALGLVPRKGPKCTRCLQRFSGPAIAGKLYGTVICAACARAGSPTEQLMASMVKRPRGRQPKKETER